MKKMSTIKFPNQAEAYEVVDKVARTGLDNKSNIGHIHVRSEITDFAHEHDERYYTETEIDEKLETTANTKISTHNTSDSAHNDIRLLITGLTNRLNALANSDDTTLDQMAELVEYIKDNRELIEEVTTNKVNVSDIIDNLTTNVANKPLSAAQGVALKALIDAIEVPVQSVNGKTGTVQLSATDVGADASGTANAAMSEHNEDPMSHTDIRDALSTVVYINPEDNENIEDPEIPAITVDDALSETSTNPVQNNVITAELNKKITSSDLTDAINAIPNASTNIYGLTKLSTSTSGTSEILAATESAVKLAYDKGINAETVANAALPKTGGTMTGALVAQSNNDYDTKQVRNIFLVAEGEDLPAGSNGDICLVYTP